MATLESELKLRADADVLGRLDGEPLQERRFTSTYYDTGDHRLARSGVTLRRRVEHGKSVWQLKLPRGATRLEVEHAGGPAGPPPRIAELVVALVHARELAPVTKLRTVRRGVRVAASGGSTADVVMDEVAVLDGRKVTESFNELEIEVLNGDAQALEDVEQELRKAGAKHGDPRPKVLRALGLDAHATPKLAAGASAIEHVQARLEQLHEQLLAHDPRVRLGDDPEALHQLRVATRRLRALLRAARPILVREWADSLRRELEWLADVLAPARDLDVLVAHLRQEAADFPPDERRALSRPLDALADERRETGAEVHRALESERYLELLSALERAARAPHVVSRDVSLNAVAAREFRKLRRKAKALSARASDDELHALRIRGKRARYAAELAQPVAGKRATKFTKRAKEFQDVIGEHQDAVVAEERLRDARRSARGASTAFVLGRLVERQRSRRLRARAELPSVWKQLERSGRKAWS